MPVIPYDGPTIIILSACRLTPVSLLQGTRNQRAQKASLPGAVGIRDVFVATKTQTCSLQRLKKCRYRKRDNY